MLIVIFEWVLDLVDISFKSIYTLRIVLTSYTDPLVRGEDTFHINCYESIVLVFFFVIPVNKPVHKQVVYYISSVWTVYAMYMSLDMFFVESSVRLSLDTWNNHSL